MIKYKTTTHPSGHIEKLLVDDTPKPKEYLERQWRDNELAITDKLVNITDYPEILMTDLLSYRAELRDYPAHVDFPNGARPTL